MSKAIRPQCETLKLDGTDPVILRTVVVFKKFIDLIFNPYSDCSEDMKRLLASYTKEKGKNGLDNAYSTYTSPWGSNPSQETIKKTVVAIGTDYIFLVPTQTALYLHASNAG